MVPLLGGVCASLGGGTPSLGCSLGASFAPGGGLLPAGLKYFSNPLGGF